MLSGTSAGVFNISHFFQVFWSETGSAMEYGEDFARMIYKMVATNEMGITTKGDDKRNGDEKRDVDGKRDCHDTTGF